MEGTSPGPNKGYQKQVKKDATPPPKSKIHPTTDYSSPAAKKWPKFVAAIESGDVESVKQFIDEGMNINLLRDGVTPLMIAASSGKRDVAEALLQAGVNINEPGEDGGTALHKAASDQEETSVVELLMESGVAVEVKNKAGRTALQLAEEKGNREIVKVIQQHLARQGADAREWEEFLNSAEGKPFKQQRQYDSLMRYSRLWWAPIPALAVLGALAGWAFGAVVVTGIVGAVIGLLTGGGALFKEKQLRKDLDETGPLPELDIHTLRMKRKTGEPIFPVKIGERESGEVFSESLAKEEASLAESEPGGAINDTVVIEEIIPAEPAMQATTKQARRMSPAIVAAAASVLILALAGGAAFYKKDSLARWYYVHKLERSGLTFSGPAYLEAAANNNEAALDLFLKAGIAADVQNDKGQTALIIAAEKGYPNLIDKLAKLKPPLLNQADKSGKTALMTAVRQGREPVVQALLANGADINYVVPGSPGAATALQAVLDTADFREEHLAMVKSLIERGADVKVRNGAGQSPLMFTADRGRMDVARLLLEKGAAADAADLKGGVPLLLAACKGNSGFIALLAEKGANMKVALPDGQTPLMCAVQMGYADAVRTLLEKGADANAKTTNGTTALFDATRMGQVEIAKLLLARGADRGSGYLPESFKALKGKTVAVAGKKSTLNAVLGKIIKTASQDGYVLHADTVRPKTVNLKAKAPWNKMLQDLAASNRLLLVVKEKEIFLLQ